MKLRDLIGHTIADISREDDEVLLITTSGVCMVFTIETSGGFKRIVVQERREVERVVKELVDVYVEGGGWNSENANGT